jgi:hypothetical protein
MFDNQFLTLMNSIGHPVMFEVESSSSSIGTYRNVGIDAIANGRNTNYIPNLLDYFSVVCEVMCQ